MDYKQKIADKFSETELIILENVSANNITSYGLGVPVPLLLEPQTISILRDLISFLNSEKIDWIILGAGSNVVLPDKPLQKVIIRLGREFDKLYFFKLLDDALAVSERNFEHSDVGLISTNILSEKIIPEINAEDLSDGDNIYALTFASSSLVAFASKMSKFGLSGLEYGGGIPGTIGGAVLINAGAHGWSIGSIIEAVWILDETLKIRKILKKDLEFSYRNSNIPKNTILLAALLRFTKAPIEEVTARRKEGLDYRKQYQPINFPSCGSVFRNPSASTNNAKEQTKLPPAGKLIDDAGLKGFRVGGMEVSTLNANWIVKVADTAKASDLIEIIDVVKKKVKEMSGIDLECEVKFL